LDYSISRTPALLFHKIQMAERRSFTAEQAEAVTNRLGLRIERIIPTRRGSVIITATDTERNVLKIADLKCAETEQLIAPSRSEGIENEARTLCILESGIAPALRTFERDERLHIVFSAIEYINGFAPDYRIMRGLDQCLGSTIHLLQSIAKIHAKKIIHGDVQPENILWLSGDHRQVRLIDFELSKRTEEPVISKPGLYHFLSPEAAEQVLNTGKCIIDIAEETFATAATTLALLKGSKTPIEYTATTTRKESRLQEIMKAGYDEKGVVPDAIDLARRIVHVLLSPANNRPKTPLELLDFLKPCLKVNP